MAIQPEHNFFFIHVMKTGGTSFAEVLRKNFTQQERYPQPSENQHFFEHMENYVHVPKFVANVNAKREQLRMVSAHVPYAVHTLLEGNYKTLTVLRNPVDRIISYLKHCRRYHIEHMNRSLEEIYEDKWFKASFIQNYQTKIFSMSTQESLAENRFIDGSPIMPPRSEMGEGNALSPELKQFRDKAPGRFCLEFFAASTGVINIDESRLALAKKNLSNVDVVGVTEYFDVFLTQLSERFGFKIISAPRKHVGEAQNISADFRKRIASDNQFDSELHEYAKALIV